MKLKPYKTDALTWNPLQLSQLFDWALPQMTDNSITGDTVRFNNTSDQFTVELDLPGVTKENIELEVFGQRVYIKAKRTVTSNSGVREEVINRSFTMDSDADLDALVAKQDNGVLTLSTKRKNNSKNNTRRVNIS